MIPGEARYRALTQLTPMSAKAALTLLDRLAARRLDQSIRLREALQGRLASLGRIALVVASETGDPIGHELSALVNVERDDDVVYILAKELEETHRDSIPLREVTAVARGRVWRTLQATWPNPDPEQRAELARWANNYASALFDLRRPEEALKMVDVALSSFQGAEAEGPQTEVALSLFNRSLALSLLERREEAVVAARESFEMYRALGENGPAGSRVRADWAQAASNLGNRLAEVGRSEDALEPTSEAVRLYRELIRDRSLADLPNLAMSLANLGNRLGDVNRKEEALAVTEEALDYYERLAEARPDIYRPALAMCLTNLGIRRFGLGLLEPAYQASLRSTQIYRQLSQERPDLFRPGLAKSLNALGNRFGITGRNQQAFEATWEATGIYRELAEQHPGAFLPELAICLQNLTSWLIRRELWGEALKVSQEAVDRLKDLAKESPQRFLPILAKALNHMAIIYMYTGFKEGCLEASLTATALFRRLAREHPEAYELDLAQSLANLGVMYGYAGSVDSHDAEEGLRVSREAVDLFRGLVPRAPMAIRPLLAGSLHSMGKCLLRMERAEDALKIFAEAIDTLRPFHREYPEAWGDRMEMMLVSYGDTARALGVPTEPP